MPFRPAASDSEWDEHSISGSSTTTAFDDGIKRRETLWTDLKNRGWVPVRAKNYAQHEPCNGLLMCPTHRVCFDEHYFFIRFHPDVSLIFLFSELRVHQKQI